MKFVYIVFKSQLIKGKKLLENPYIPLLREYSKYGIPNTLRKDIWCHLLGYNINNKNEYKLNNNYFNYLLDSVDQWDIITDSLYRLDVEQTLDHYDFFPFDDFLNDIILAFSRDPTIEKLCNVTVNTVKQLNTL